MWWVGSGDFSGREVDVHDCAHLMERELGGLDCARDLTRSFDLD